MPDPALSAALKEAYASAPVNQIIYHTLEIWHASFAAPLRIVRDRASLDARIEAGAPRDAGGLVTFVGFAFDITPPEQTSTGVPQCTIEIDNVDRTLVALIEATAGSGTPIVVLYRSYLSDTALVGPETVPVLTLTIQSVTVDPFRIRAVAGFPDLLNLKFPKLEYEMTTFPGLAA